MKPENLARPTESQIRWADAEIGVIILCDIEICQPEWRHMVDGELQDPPSLSVFNPRQLDTDQWIQAAVAVGAKYAVLTAKHVTGFTLFPDEEYDYAIDNTPFQEGNGNIVKDFVKSCRKYGVEPGIYYSCEANSHLGIHKGSGNLPKYPSKEWEEFKTLVKRHLTHLWSNYGDFLEIWFDGSLLKHGPDYLGLLKRYQPRCVAFQGSHGFSSRLRWVGNENGLAPCPCWSSTGDVKHFDGTKANEKVGKGNPDGVQWVPAETDVPLRYMQWFWKPNQHYLVAPPEEILNWYYHSVGRNSNLLIGIVVDDRGLVPQTDMQSLSKFGDLIESFFGKPIREISGRGLEKTISFSEPQEINHVVIMEDISKGHRIRRFVIERKTENEKWESISEGTDVGHKRILEMPKTVTHEIRVRVMESVGIPVFEKIAAYYFEKPKID